MRYLRFALLGLLALTALVLGEGRAGPAYAATFTVNSTRGDEGEFNVDDGIWSLGFDDPIMGEPVSQASLGNGRLQIHHLDVEHGDAALIISPNGQVAMVDNGRTECPNRVDYLKSLGITSIDYHFASHYDADHIGCLDYMALKGITVAVACYDRGFSKDPITQTFLDYVATCGDKRQTLSKDQVVKLDPGAQEEVTITVVDLNGAGVPSGNDENALSVVLRVSYGAFDEVMGGDLTGSSPNIESTVGPQVGDVEVYKVHHHGSDTSTKEDWLSATTPEVGIISLGEAYQNPAAEVMGRLHDYGVKTYWTNLGSGATPDPAWDKVGGNIIVEAEPGVNDSYTVYGSSFADCYDNDGVGDACESRISSVLVDDFVPPPVQEYPFEFKSVNRLGGNSGQIGESGSGNVNWEKGAVTATITEGTDTLFGVWTSLNHHIEENLAIDFSAIFPPQIKSVHQGEVTGIVVRVLDGQGTFKVELQAPSGSFLWSGTVTLNGGQQEIQFDLPDDPSLEEIRNLNWVVEGGAGDFVAVDRVELIVELPAPATAQRAFLWSYAMLLSNWDPASGLTRDSAKWRADVDDRGNVSASGAQAAAAALASDLGLISRSDAIEIVTNTAAGLMALPRCHGLWPHFVQGGQIFPDERDEWSSIDTIIAIVALLEAQQALGIETAAMEQVLKDIDWAGLILPDGSISHGSISHGYNHDCSERLEAGWKDFGTESWLVNFGYASATDNVAEFDHEGPTFNGSGFIDELAWLLVPPLDRDRWGTEWEAHSQEAASEQLGYYTDPDTDHYHACYDQLGLFGLSAAEVPDPSIVVDPDDIYQAFGVGGTEAGPPNDGIILLGHAVIVPHYAALIASLRPDEGSALWNWMEGTGILTPLNNVESFMFIDEPACEEVVWNGLKGSWNLGLQTLGWGRLLAGSDNPLYAGLLANDILRRGYSRMSDSRSDFTGDGKDDVVRYVISSGNWWVLRSIGTAFNPENWATFSTKTGWDPQLVGDFNGDAKDDVVNYHPPSGTWWVNVSTGSSFHPQLWAAFRTKWGWDPQLVGDFNGDGKDDVVNYHPASGRWWVNVSTGTGFDPQLWAAFRTRRGWDPQLVGDFNGDGKDDIVNYHPASGTWWVNVSTGSGFHPKLWGKFRTKWGWDPQLVGDFDGDGKDDVVNYHPASGRWWVNVSTGTGFDPQLWATFSTKTGWDPQLVGDFNGDGKDDVVNYHPASGTWWVNVSTGSGFVPQKWATFSTRRGWDPQLVGDFNGDGKDDVANYHSASGTWWVNVSTGSGFVPQKWATFKPW